MSTKYFNKCGNQKDHQEHHLCQIILRKDLGLIRELVKDAQYYCKNCGRAANDLKKLCNPSKI